LLVGVFLSLPTPGATGQLAIRNGLFQLLPIALLALLARRPAALCMVAVMVGLAAVRVLMHGAPATGSALYWLYTATTVGFGLMLKGYRMDFAISAFQMRNRLRLQAVTDGLTGLINREGWNREAAAAYMSAHESARALSFAFFDIDHFKGVNDTHGHDAGDRVLQALGRILRERTDCECISARLGGEEFVVLFAGRTPAQVEALVQQVRGEFEREVAAFKVTVSAGVAHRQQAEPMDLHLRRTDIALYEAKRAGRDRLVVSTAPLAASA
jgi:diguanylate cyclase (GGDEF)-like protein